MRARWIYLLSGIIIMGSTLACFTDQEEGAELESRTGGNSASGYFLAQPSYNGLSGSPINIAVGARYDVTIWDWEDISAHLPAQLSEARSSDEAIVKIIERRGDLLILEGVAPGESSVIVTGLSDGERVAESIQVSVAHASVVELDEPCGSTHLVSGKDNYITHSFRDLPGSNLYGYGLSYLSANPDEGEVLLEGGTERLQIVRVNEGVINSINLIDKLTMRARPILVTAPAELIKLQLYPEDWALSGTTHPAITTLIAKATLQGQEEVCPVIKYKLSIKSPEVCALENIRDSSPTDPQQPTTIDKVRLITKGAGQCTVALFIAEDQGFGGDKTLTHTFEIAPPPARERE